VNAKSKPPFNVATFLATVDGGRTISTYRKNRRVFLQGDLADSVFYIQEGQVKVYVVSEQGKEAVVAIHAKGDFFGEGCLTQCCMLPPNTGKHHALNANQSII